MTPNPSLHPTAYSGLRPPAFAFLLFIAVPASAADSFEARVQRAKTIEASLQGQAFQKVFWDHVGDYTAKAMQRCFPKDVKPDTEFFTLVADLTPGRALSMIEIQPATRMSQCFAQGFANAPFPEPPQSFGNEGLPLVIEMKIKP